MENSSKSGLGIRITSDLHDLGEPVNSNLPSFYPTPHWPPPPVVTWNFLWPLPSPIRLSVSVSFSFWVVRVVYEVAEYSCRITTSTSHVTEGVCPILAVWTCLFATSHRPFPQISSSPAPPWSSRMCVIAHFDRVCGLLGRFLFSSYLLFFFLLSRRAYTPFFYVFSLCSNRLF